VLPQPCGQVLPIGADGPLWSGSRHWSADMNDTAGYLLTVSAPIGASLLDVLRARFDEVAVSAADRTVLRIDNLDQASVRALMTLVWDAGHEVVALEAL
jgi:hypothetical protein